MGLVAEVRKLCALKMVHTFSVSTSYAALKDFVFRAFLFHFKIINEPCVTDSNQFQ